MISHLMFQMRLELQKFLLLTRERAPNLTYKEVSKRCFCASRAAPICMVKYQVIPVCMITLVPDMKTMATSSPQWQNDPLDWRNSATTQTNCHFVWNITFSAILVASTCMPSTCPVVIIFDCSLSHLQSLCTCPACDPIASLLVHSATFNLNEACGSSVCATFSHR